MSPAPNFVRITLPLAAVNFLNQCSRGMVATIGPLLAVEFDLSASGLGLLAACYFAAYAAAQLPIGLALDLYGPRRVQMVLALVAAGGFVLSALAWNVGVLAIARMICGVGLAAGLMAMLKAHAQWYAKERVAAVTGAGLFLAGLGAMAATLPVQWAVPVLGWRGLFLLLGLMAFASSLAISLWMPERVVLPSPTARGSVRAEIAEFGRIFRNRLFLRFLPAIMVLSALNFTFQGLWAGPWLRDVAGLAEEPRALVLLIYALGMVSGSLLTGHAASAVQARGFSPFLVPYLGMGGMVAAQAALISAPAGFCAAAVIWFAFGFMGSVGVAGYAAIGQGFPPELQGRVATAINFSMLLLVFLLQTGIGAILDLWPRTADGGWAPAGYRLALVATASLQAATLLWSLGGWRHRRR